EAVGSTEGGCPQGFPHCCPVKSAQRKCPAPDERDRGGRPLVRGTASASGSAWPRRLREAIPSCNKGAGRRSHYTGRCFRVYLLHADREARGKRPAARDLRIQGVCERWGAYVLRDEPCRHVSSRRYVRGQDFKGHEARRSSGGAAEKVRVHHQSESSEADRPDDSAE